ncbi:MAG TPA: CHRD domain-containing protein [Acidimicrobiia bacterium]|nr:CHRD domain-containing protein [Acidimicrobiia bacterium]
MRVRVSLATALVLSGLAALGEAPPLGADSSDEARLIAALSAKEIVPGPGPEGGSGTALIDTDADESRLCFELTYQGISRPASGSVRRGPAGTNGPVEVDFNVARFGDKGCVTGDPTILKAIAANPGGHYVILTTNEYPDGAIRGQLQQQD